MGRQGPHRDSQGLRTGIPAHGGDDGHQDGQRDDLLDRRVELGDDDGSENRRHQIEQQPGEAIPRRA